MSAHDVLRRVPAFADLANDDLDVVLGILKARRGGAGDVLFRQGDRGESLVIVLEGELVARVRTAGGVEEEVARLGPGEVVGEMAFIDAEPRSATIATVGGATVIELTRDALASLRRTAPRVARAIQKNVIVDVGRRLREAGEKLSEGARASVVPAERAKRQGRQIEVNELRRLEAFRGSPEDDLVLLSHVAVRKSYAVGEIVVREGDVGESCFIVGSGAVAVTRGTSQQPIATLHAGALVGQLALLDSAPRSATVRAVVDTIALEVPSAGFTNLLASHAPIALRFQWQVALSGVRQLREATQRLAFVATRLTETSGRMLDDWDEGETADGDRPDLELAVDPRSIRR